MLVVMFVTVSSCVFTTARVMVCSKLSRFIVCFVTSELMCWAVMSNRPFSITGFFFRKYEFLMAWSCEN